MWSRIKGQATKVLALPPADREFIAERIDETLDQETGSSPSPFATPELAQAWAAERRLYATLEYWAVRRSPAAG
jgi:hypothetical protein